MSSFALWFETESGENERFCADVHFNLWNLHGHRNYFPCLDVGIKIVSPEYYSKVFFYIPWEINSTDFQDLGKSLKTSELLCAVFNEDYKMLQNAQSKIVCAENNAAKMNIYCLDVENDVSFFNSYGGTVVSFDRPKQLIGSHDTEYYRFRIGGKCLKNIIKSYNPRNILLQSAISTTEAIDFRFNDYRSLPLSLLEIMQEGKKYQIGKVHFFLIVEPDVDLIYSSTIPMARELEKDIWERYYEDVGQENVVAYHWKFKSEDAQNRIENCIMFVKARIHVCNWKTIISYIICAGGLAVVYNFLSHLLF